MNQPARVEWMSGGDRLLMGPKEKDYERLLRRVRLYFMVGTLVGLAVGGIYANVCWLLLVP